MQLRAYFSLSLGQPDWCFNSKKVQLRVGLVNLFEIISPKFQFQKGAIKRILIGKSKVTGVLFQFQKGAIKSMLPTFLNDG